MKYRTRKRLARAGPMTVVCAGVILMLMSGVKLHSYVADIQSSKQEYTNLMELVDADDNITQEDVDAQIAEWEQEREYANESYAEDLEAIDAAAAEQDSRNAENSKKVREKLLAKAQIAFMPKWLKKHKYYSIYRRNTDTRGYIYLPGGTKFPVMEKPEDEHFYLRRDFNGNYNVNGTPYLDLRSAGIGRWGISIIYGHNMENGSMFAPLQQYLKRDFFEKNRYMQIDSLKYTCGWEVMGVMLTDATASQSIYDHVGRLGRNEFATWKRLAQKDLQVGNIDRLKYTDSIMLLSTCNSYLYEGREVVILKRIYPFREAELIKKIQKESKIYGRRR